MPVGDGLEWVKCKKCRRKICRAIYEVIEVVCPKCHHTQTIYPELNIENNSINLRKN